jgi:hypothetical protein
MALGVITGITGGERGRPSTGVNIEIYVYQFLRGYSPFRNQGKDTVLMLGVISLSLQPSRPWLPRWMRFNFSVVC